MSLSNILSVIEVAKLGSKALGALFSDTTEASGTDFAKLLAHRSAALDKLEGLETAGRNLSLSDPEAAYQMMTRINASDVRFKAQTSELDALGKRVEEMEALGAKLSDIGPETSNADIASRMGDFVSAYNQWIDRFAPSIARGGVLDDVQAAEVSRHALESAVRSPFNGAVEGVRGMAALGIEIDPQTHRATLDTTRLNEVLASNKQGAVSAIDEFSANFAKSADLLNADDNFIPRRLDNQRRAIEFLANHLPQLRQEFGLGDPAQASGQIAQALAAYNSAYAIR